MRFSSRSQNRLIPLCVFFLLAAPAGQGWAGQEVEESAVSAVREAIESLGNSKGKDSSEAVEKIVKEWSEAFEFHTIEFVRERDGKTYIPQPPRGTLSIL
jgi:hypothetical protein